MIARQRVLALGSALVPALGAVTMAVGATPPDAVRAGGPSAPGDAKVALVGSSASLVGRPFRVTGAGGRIVLRGTLARAVGTPAPWRFAAQADLGGLAAPGRYVVRVGRLRSAPWVVAAGATSAPLRVVLGYFAANSDGTEPSPEHRPAHLNDAEIATGPFKGQRFDLTGGWMDAGDTLKFTTTTGYTAMALQAAARLSPPDAAALTAAADVGVRWLVKAHPAPELFIAQVGDERDHELGFRDPGADDRSAKAGIGRRFAYPNMGGDLGGKAAAALALAADRTPAGPAREALVRQARDWYAAGVASGRVAPKLPKPVGDFYVSDTQEDALAAGAAALYRTTGEAAFLADALRFLDEIAPDGRLSWNAVAGFAAADLCGVLGAPPVADAAARARACDHLRAQGAAAAARGRIAAFGTPGVLTWGTTGENAGAGVLAALAEAAGTLPGGRGVGAAARDWLLGRNAWGSSFVVGFGPRAPRAAHHWASLRGRGRPRGAVVGGPAPLKDIRDQQPDIGTFRPGRFDAAIAGYEDRRDNYVTSEPALDYAAGSALLLAVMRGA